MSEGASGVLYLVTTIVVAPLYLPCRGYARFKEQRLDRPWLSCL